jgi:hypothetical protein
VAAHRGNKLSAVPLFLKLPFPQKLKQCLLAAVDGAALAAHRDKLSAATALVTPAAAVPAQPLLLKETSCQVYLLRPFLAWLFLPADVATYRDKL